jgi:hypothetical protein
MFEYDHKDAETAWPEGQYPATFLGALDGISKTSKQPMQTWTFEVYDNANDRKQTIKDYVTPAALFKVRQLAGALNKAAEFKANKFYPEDHAGASVMLSLIIEPSDGQFDEKNKIARISAAPGTAKPTTAAEKMLSPQPSLSSKAMQTVPADSQPPIKDEDIPF